VTAIGYARASTTDRDLALQEKALKAAGCEVIRAELTSDMNAGCREERRKVLHSLRSGDVLVVTRIDRLACNILDLQDILCAIEAEGASLKITEEHIDTNTPAGKMLPRYTSLVC
jgi:DNA invertase Pin-like site-specific DNA recombinase